MSEPLRSGPPPRGAQSRASACAAAATAGSVLSTLWTRPAPHRAACLGGPGTGDCFCRTLVITLQW